MLKVLVLHHNFPGQFGGILEMCKQRGDDVIFICETNYKKNTGDIKVYEIGELKGDKQAFGSISTQVLCAMNFDNKLEELKKENYVPDVIISHSGWGCGLYAKTIAPESKLICYCEWWFKYDAAEFQFKENEYIDYSKSVKKNMYLRNLPLAAELAEAEELITPTKWQKSQFPANLVKNMHVIHEGVDTSYFVQNRSSSSSNISSTSFFFSFFYSC